MSQSEENALRYNTGEVAEIGDSVLIEQGRTPGELYAIIASDNDENGWRLEKLGFMVKAGPFGVVFWPQSDTDPVILVSRRNASQHDLYLKTDYCFCPVSDRCSG